MRLSFAEKQIRARCWWAIYGLERWVLSPMRMDRHADGFSRLVSISLGRPLGVDDEDIDIGLPAEVDDQALLRFSRNGIDPNPLDKIEEPPESTMSGFVALTKLCRIAGRVAHVLYRPSNGRSVSDQSWAASQQNTINKLDQLLRDWLAHVVVCLASNL